MPSNASADREVNRNSVKPIVHLLNQSLATNFHNNGSNTSVDIEV
jgi:hypothetical protein